MEWADPIVSSPFSNWGQSSQNLRPSDLSATTSREVYAFFEFQHTLSAGERPPEVMILVKQLLEHSAKDGGERGPGTHIMAVFTLFSKDSDVAFPCSSFLVIVNRQKRESNNSFAWKIIALSVSRRHVST